jgi:hypothetical protein
LCYQITLISIIFFPSDLPSVTISPLVFPFYSCVLTAVMKINDWSFSCCQHC